jgi:hypothetical protein
VSAALLLTDQSNAVSSASGAPIDRNSGLSTQVATGCTNGETLTLQNGTSTTKATIQVTASGGFVSAVTITNPGAYTAMPGATPTWTASGTCTTASVNTWLQIGFGISSVTGVTAGTNYPCLPLPEVWTTGATPAINTHGRFVATMTCAVNPITVNKGAQSAPAWSTGGLIFGASGTQTLTDTTSTTGGGTLATEAAWALPVYQQDCTAACTITNVAELYVPAPLNTANVTATNLWSLMANGGIKTNGALSASGGAVNLGVNNAANVTNIGTGTTSGAINIGGGSDTIALGSDIKVGGNKLCSVTMPTVASGAGTSPTVTGTNTCAFRVTVGASGTPAAAVQLTMPAAQNGWNCHASDETTAAGGVARQSADTATSVTVTFAAAPSLNDKLAFLCGAF